MISEIRIGAIRTATIYRTRAIAPLDLRSQASPLLRQNMPLIRQIILYICYQLSNVWTVPRPAELVAALISRLANASQKYKRTVLVLMILIHIQEQVVNVIMARLKLQLFFLTIAHVRLKMKLRSFC